MNLVVALTCNYGHTFHCFFEGGGVAKAKIPGYFTVHDKVKCYIDSLVIASKYKLRTMNGNCCVQPSLSLSSSAFYCRAEQDKWKEYQQQCRIISPKFNYEVRTNHFCSWNIHIINPFFVSKSVPRSLSQNLDRNKYTMVTYMYILILHNKLLSQRTSNCVVTFLNSASMNCCMHIIDSRIKNREKRDFNSHMFTYMFTLHHQF